jgi:hypothetical protein
MQTEYDYEEAVMNEMIPLISVPTLVPASTSTRDHYPGNSSMLLDLEKLIEE